MTGRAFAYCRIGPRETKRYCQSCGLAITMDTMPETLCRCGATVQQPFALDSQRERVAEYYRTHLAEHFTTAGVLAEFCPTGSTGGLTSKPNAYALFHHLRRGDCLIVPWMTRGWGHVRDAEHELRALHRIGVWLYSARDGLMMDPNAKMMPQVRQCQRTVEDQIAEDMALLSRKAFHTLHPRTQCQYKQRERQRASDNVTGSVLSGSDGPEAVQPDTGEVRVEPLAEKRPARRRKRRVKKRVRRVPDWIDAFIADIRRGDGE